MPEQNGVSRQNSKRSNYRKNKNNYRKGNSVNNKRVLHETNEYSYDTSLLPVFSIFGDYIDSAPFSPGEIAKFARNPQFYNKELRRLAWWAYDTDGSVKSAVNYICSMHTLDKVIVCRNNKKKRPKNFQSNRIKMLDVLNKINYKQQIRDNLMKNANDGTAFYYFEINSRPCSNAKFISDIDIANITEINELNSNISIIPLPVDWCRICGIKNNHYTMAFNLRYFEQFAERELKSRLRSMPKEIRDSWNKRDQINNWVVLDDSKTIVTKVNAPINKPWGVPMAVSAFDDILYSDYFIKTKRTVLDSINNQIIYMTFPEGKEKGTSSLSKTQQREQHDAVKDAVINRRSQSGISFFSLASGTKIDKIDVNTDIFDEKNENAIKGAVPSDMGMSSASLDGSTKGNYATATLNLELVAGYVYTWIENYMTELNKCINLNVIKDSTCLVDCYIPNTTFANRKEHINEMKELYSHGKGSLIAWISACGYDADAYLSLLDFEVENDFENKYPVHATSFTMSGKDGAASDKDHSSGREEIDKPTNENTIQSKSSGANMTPKPSTV